jgi:hypothetical protein
VQTIIGTEPHMSVMGMPQLIMLVIMSQHILSISMLIMPVGFMVQLMPLAVISQLMVGHIGMPQQPIMGMPAHIIMHGVPFFIMTCSIAQISFIMSMLMPSAGIIMHFMPCSDIEQLMWHDIGIIMGTGIGIPDIDPGADVIGICMDMGEAAFMCDSRAQAAI